MTGSGTFANPLTAEGRRKFRENWRTGRETMDRYPGAQTAVWITGAFFLVLLVGFNPEGGFRRIFLFASVAGAALVPLNIVCSALLAEAAHIRFGLARSAILFVAILVTGGGVRMLRESAGLDPFGEQTGVVALFGLLAWTATLLCASYLRQGRATPPPEPGEFDHLARGQLSLAMGGALAAGFALVAILLAVWIAP